LEEGGLAWFHASVASRDEDVERSHGARTGWCGNTVGEDLVAGGFEVAVGEDEADVAFDVREKTLVLGVLGDEGLDGTADLIFINMMSSSQQLPISSLETAATYHSILSHQHDTLTTQALADLVHLLRGDIVDGDDEDALVLLEEPFELVEVAGLVCGPAPHSVCAV
jgi:hypothetical protein